MTHHLPTALGSVKKYPVSVAEALRLLVAVGVGAGWLTVQQADVLTLGLTALGVLVSVGLSWWSSRKVTALAKPRNADGTPLVPALSQTKIAE